MAISIAALALITVVIAQRLLELRLAERNTARLRARGGYEVGEDHYPFMVVLHLMWVASLAAFGWSSPIRWPWVVVYGVLQVFRAWILVSLGDRWTTRIIVIDEPLVRRGPYRFLAHPNYVVVFLELLVVPLALGRPLLAVLFGVLHAEMLAVRVRTDDEALRQS